MNTFQKIKEHIIHTLFVGVLFMSLPISMAIIISLLGV